MATMGVGVAFTGRDEGMEGAMNNAERHLDTLNQMLESQGKAADKAGQRTSNWLGMLRNLQLGGIAGQLNEMVGAGNNLTTSLEGTFAALTKEAKPFSAQLGLTGREARKMTGSIAGLAHALNVGPDSVGKTMVALKTFGKGAKEVFDEMGISTKDLVKAEASGIINTQDFISVMSDLRNSWQFSKKAAGEVVDEVTAMGQAAGLGGEAMNLLKKTVDAADEVLAQTGRTITEMDMRKAIEGTQQVAAAFVRLGDAPSVAAEKAANLFKTIQTEAVTQEKMVAGLGGEYGAFFKNLVRDAGLGFDRIQDLFTMDPSEMVRGLAGIQEALKKKVEEGAPGAQEAMTRFNATVSEAGLTFVLSTGPETIEAMDAVKAAAQDATGAFKQTADEGFSSGRTLSETFDLAKEGFIASFRAITRKRVRDDVKAQMQSFKSMAVTLRETAEEGGMLGDVIKRASAMSQLGLRGLFIDLDKTSKEASKFSAVLTLMGEGVLGVAAEMQPLFIALTPLAPILSKLGGLLFSWPGLLLAGGAAIVLFGDEIIEFGKEMLPKALDKMIDIAFAAWDFAVKIVDELVVKVAQIDWGRVMQAMADGLLQVHKFIAGALTGDFDTSFLDGLRKASEGRKLAGGMEDAMADAIGMLKGKEKKFAKIGGGMAEAIMAGLQEDIEAGKLSPEKAFEQVFEKLRKAGVSEKSATGIAFHVEQTMRQGLEQGERDAVERASMGERISEGISEIPTKIWEAWEKFDLIGTIEGAFGNVEGLATRLEQWVDELDVSGMVQSVSSKMQESFAQIDWGRIFVAAGKAVFAIGRFLVTLMFKGFELLVTSAMEYVPLAISWFGGILGGLGDAIPVLWGETIAPALSAMWGKIGETFVGVKETLKTKAYENIVNPVAEAFLGIGDKFYAAIFGGEEGGGLVGTLVGAATRFKEAGVKFVEEIWNGIVERWDQLVGDIEGKLATLTGYFPWTSPAKEGPLEEGGGLRQSGRNFFEEILIGMKSFSETFFGGVESIMVVLAQRASSKMESELKTALTTSFENIGVHISEQLMQSASGAIDQFLTFAWGRAQMRAGAVSEAAVAALESAIMQANQLDVGATMTQELEVKSSVERTFVKAIEAQTRYLLPELQAIKRATTQTVEKLATMRTVVHPGRREAMSHGVGT